MPESQRGNCPIGLQGNILKGLAKPNHTPRNSVCPKPIPTPRKMQATAVTANGTMLPKGERSTPAPKRSGDRKRVHPKRDRQGPPDHLRIIRHPHMHRCDRHPQKTIRCVNVPRGYVTPTDRCTPRTIRPAPPTGSRIVIRLRTPRANPHPIRILRSRESLGGYFRVPTRKATAGDICLVRTLRITEIIAKTIRTTTRVIIQRRTTVARSLASQRGISEPGCYRLDTRGRIRRKRVESKPETVAKELYSIRIPILTKKTWKMAHPEVRTADVS